MSNYKQLWDEYGKDDAYYAVATIDKFKAENLNDENLNDFFGTGEEYVDEIWKTIEKNFITDFKPKTALDFGCGVGRLTIPLAEKCEKIIGVDISATMVQEAEKNAKIRNLQNTEFIQDSEGFVNSVEKFDLVHSYIVIQHIVPKIGYQVFEELVNKVKEGGIGVLQLTFFNPGSLRSKIISKLYLKFPFLYQLRNKVKNQKPLKLLPIHEYDLNQIFYILQKKDCHRCHIRFTFHGLHGILIFFQKGGKMFTK